jgi:hypothetical protein
LGTAVWGAIFLARGASTAGAHLAGTPAGIGGRPRQLIEAFSGGGFASAVHAVSPSARGFVIDATQQGFLSGLNIVLVIGGVVTLVSAALTLWLVRETEIERGEEVDVYSPRTEQLDYAQV